MADTVVQLTGFGTEVSVSPGAQTFAKAVSAGNRILVGCAMENNFNPGNITGVWDNLGTTAMSSFALTGTGGQFSCSAMSLYVGQAVTLSGTLTGTATLSAAFASASQSTSTGVFTTAAQSLVAGQAVTITGTLPTGFTAGVQYYVLPTNLTSTTCELSQSPGGNVVVPTVSASCTLNTALYASPTVYLISATNGSTTGTLMSSTGSVLTTTAGSTTGLTVAVGNNVYSEASEHIDGESGDNNRSEFWECYPVVSGGIGTITAAYNSTQDIQICLMEISGFPTIGQTTGSGTTANPLTLTANGYSAVAGCLEVVLCSVAFGASAISNPATTTNYPRFTTWALGTGDSGGGQNQASYRISTGRNIMNATWNWTVAESGAGTGISFQPTPGVPFPSIPKRRGAQGGLSMDLTLPEWF